jgi:cytochrome c biogenesis protein CcmG, thiol:disulfide interchange protein DsbE
MSSNRLWQRALLALGGGALLVLLAIGLLQLTSSARPPAAPSRLTVTQMQARLVGSPAPLAALHAQADALLPGDKHALHARLATLRGRPVVINKWASWCEPCRAESGAFQRASVNLGREVAFIGLDSGDTNRGEALRFLRSHPVSYPSYYDPTEHLGIEVTDSSFQPVTVFYNRHGGEYIHQGAYPSLIKLESDVKRYALDS